MDPKAYISLEITCLQIQLQRLESKLPARSSNNGMIVKKLSGFFNGLDFDKIDSAVEYLRELQASDAQQGFSENTDVIEMLLDLLEQIVDTSEACNYKFENLN